MLLLLLIPSVKSSKMNSVSMSAEAAAAKPPGFFFVTFPFFTLSFAQDFFSVTAMFVISERRVAAVSLEIAIPHAASASDGEGCKRVKECSRVVSIEEVSKAFGK